VESKIVYSNEKTLSLGAFKKIKLQECDHAYVVWEGTKHQNATTSNPSQPKKKDRYTIPTAQ
jgi:hypothetical protein